MRRPLTLLTLGALATAGAAPAAELTLERAVELALENNPAVRSAASSADAAAERAEAARGFRLPTIDLTETYNRTDNPAEAFALTLNQERFDMMRFFESDPNDPDTLDTWITRLELQQPVYTGGELSARIEQADLMARAERLTREHIRQRVAFDTISAWVNLAKARELADLLQTARDTTAEHLGLAEQYAAEGLILDAEVLKARVYLAEMDERLERARNGARLAQAALNFQLGRKDRVRDALASPPSPPAVRGGLDSWIADGVEARRDLEAARRKLSAGRLQEDVARAAFLPEVALIGRYELYDDTAFGTHGDNGSVMAVARINLYRGGSKWSERAAARHETAAFEADLERFEEGVRLEVEQAWRELETARARHATARSSLEAAEEALRVREARFRQGLEKMIDLLDAETQLREARTRALVARYDVMLATYRLHHTAGRSLTASIDSREESS